jgi:hypothetical protein
MNTKNVIEVNGKHYDAVSGTLLAAPAATQTKPVQRRQPDVSRRVPVLLAKKVTARPVVTPLQAGRAVDGVFRTSRRLPTSAKALHKTAKPAPTHTAHPTQVVTHTSTAKPTSAHSIAVHTKAHHPQTATTLMRRAVRKPDPSLRRQVHVQTALQPQTTSLIVKKSSAHAIEPSRLERAQASSRSEHIGRFQAPKHTALNTIPVNVTPIPVRPEPVEPVDGGAPSPIPTNKPVDMFERAIANATNYVDVKAHTKHYHKKRSQHIASLAAATLALIVIAGFALYQNTPGLQFKYASFQAGVATAMPNVKAAGFAYTGVSSQFGKLTVGLKTDGNAYQLTQQSTNWTTNDLLQQSPVGTDASGQPAYQTLNAGTTAVVRFSDTSATWIKNGIWYQLSGQQPLSDSQVTSLAKNS